MHSILFNCHEKSSFMNRQLATWEEKTVDTEIWYTYASQRALGVALSAIMLKMHVKDVNLSLSIDQGKVWVDQPLATCFW